MKHYAMTGGATGIGAAIKQRLLDEGHSVIVVDIKEADIVAARRGSIVLISSNSPPMPSNTDFVDQLLAGDTAAALDSVESLDSQQVYSGTRQAVAR